MTTPHERYPSLDTLAAHVGAWCRTTFGDALFRDPRARALRVLEEALELAQALGVRKADAAALVDYTFNRPIGEPAQEVAGVAITLLAACAALDINPDAAIAAELASIEQLATIEKIRDKQRTKIHPSRDPAP